jgi:polyhydroxybutyrate depolymerase
MRLLLSAAMLLVFANLAAAERKVMTWTVDGTKRQAIVYSPSRSSGKAPLVFSFHGHGDTALNFEGVGLQDAWPEAVVIYPQGLASPRDGAPGWQNEAGLDGDRDLKLVDQVIVELHKTFSIDDSRIYATGFSNGARFSYLLWAVRPKLFAAFGPVAGMLAPSMTLNEPKPVVHVGGQQDRTNAFALQVQSIELAKKVNGVSGKGESCGHNCVLYSGKGAPVMTMIHNGGHIYPEGTSELIVKFFKQQRLDSEAANARK